MTMFARTTLTSKPVLATAAVAGVAATAYYTTRSTQRVTFDSAGMKYAGVSPQIIPDSAKMAPKKTFTGMLSSVQLKVRSVEQVNHDTKKLTFELPTNDSISGLPVASAILTQHTPAGAWIPVFRPYTPITDTDAVGTLQLLVKKYPNGRASTHMHSLEPGSTLTVRGPLPGYAYKPSNSPRNVLLIAGGAGITPIYSLTKGILSNAEDSTKVELVWGVNGTRDIVLGKELEELERQYPDRLRVTYTVSGPEASPEGPSLGDEAKYKKGRVTKAILQEVVDRCQKGTWGDEKGTQVFLCGPPAMEEVLAGKKGFGSTPGVLSELGVEKGKVYRF